MQRSSRSAGVRPARTMQHTARLLAIVLALISSANGFAIRKLEPLTSISDLETGESSLLEVRHDLQSPRNYTELKFDSNVIALNESRTTSASAEIATNSYVDLVTDATEIPTLSITQEEFIETIPTTLQPVRVDSTTSASTLTLKLEPSNVDDRNFTSPTTVTITNKKVTEVELITTETETQTVEHIVNYTIQIADFYSTTTDPTEAEGTTADSPTIKAGDSQDVTLETRDYLMSQANTVMEYTVTGVTDDEKALNTTDTTQDPSSIKFNFEVFSQSPVAETVLPSSNNPTIDFTTSTDSSTFIDQSSTVNEESFNVTMIDFTTDANEGYLENNPPTTTESFTTKAPNVATLHTENVKEEMSTLTLPTASTEGTTSFDLKMTRAESARISLEKALTNTPITSLMDLKNDLLNARENTTRMYKTTVNMTSPPKSENGTTQNIGDGVNLRTETFEIISSKRAGYLDNTDTTSTKIEEATTEKYQNINNTKDSETFGSMYETEGIEAEVSDALEVKNITGIESQSQLVEDAIKEELLMEKTLHEREYLKKKLKEDHLTKSRPVVGATPPVLEITPTIYEVVTVDVLSVKPIDIEKNQTVGLYSVSPNYKPPKKLDIQHSKQLVRDPDDNTWRNERISSLGIVFKPKNASKSFSEVLKNKTTELSYMSEKNYKNDIPDLRIRLEKIAEDRKSKKKKINAFGDIVYSDYEEGAMDNSSSSREGGTTPMSPQQKSNLIAITTPPLLSLTAEGEAVNYIQKENFKMFKEEFATPSSTSRNKLYKLRDYYDSVDDYDADYVTKIDLKKFTTTPKAETFTPRPKNFNANTRKFLAVTYVPDRQATIQYFPPTKKVKTTSKPGVNPKVNVDEYDDYFKNKVNQFTYTHLPKADYDVSFATVPPAHTNKYQQMNKETTKSHSTSAYNNKEINKNLYLTSRPNDMHGSFVSNGNINKASYVIKHYKDFIADAVKGNDDDNQPFTVAPIQGVTISDIDNFSTEKEQKRDDDYDYQTQFRKDVVNHFVENFNQNSDRFKVDFPILYNNSVIHRMIDDKGRVLASSSAFMKRLYESTSARPNFLSNVKPCDANCESMRVMDLSPAYELHYYVPEQEEKEEIEPRQNVLSYRYRL